MLAERCGQRMGTFDLLFIVWESDGTHPLMHPVWVPLCDALHFFMCALYWFLRGVGCVGGSLLLLLDKCVCERVSERQRKGCRRRVLRKGEHKREERQGSGDTEFSHQVFCVVGGVPFLVSVGDCLFVNGYGMTGKRERKREGERKQRAKTV